MKLTVVEESVVDASARARAVAHLRERGITLPTFTQLTDPERIDPELKNRLFEVDPDEPHPLNLFRVHWHNARNRIAYADVPEHLILPPSLTGVPARIVVVLGDRFPLIRAHKVLAAYACLIPRLATGQLDPTRQRAVFPSTGNYCRGGVALSRILGLRGVAVLPEGMSQERFAWLSRWVTAPEDIVRTKGSEADVRAVHEACVELARDPANVVVDQFAEAGNHLAHRMITGPAFGRLFEALWAREPGLVLSAFVAATGSAGTLGAGDWLKRRYGARIVAAEPLECPTMLYNGFGSHEIQGIGDRHVPLVHNVMNTDIVTAVSDAATDGLFLLFSDLVGQAFLAERRGVPERVLSMLGALGLSSICNIVAAIKTARLLRLGPEHVVLTVATDGAPLYASEIPRILAQRFGGTFDAIDAASTFAEHVLGAGTDHALTLSDADRRRIFNLGYFTWVEQRGLSLADFEARRAQAYWNDLERRFLLWDELIEEMNAAIDPGR
jgi:cysteine synthase